MTKLYLFPVRESKKIVQYLMESHCTQVCDLKRQTSQKPRTSPTSKPEDSRRHSGGTPQSSGKQVCSSCGIQHPRKPAYGKQCQQCNKLNHFAKYCWSQRCKVKVVERNQESSSPDALFVGAIETANKTEFTTDECNTTLRVEGHSVKTQDPK